MASPIEFRLDAASGVPTYLSLVQRSSTRCGSATSSPVIRLPKVRDVVASLAINPNTVLKAYRDLEAKGLAAGRPGQGTFVQAGLSQVAPQLAGLRKSRGWRPPPTKRAWTRTGWSRCSPARCGISMSAAGRAPAAARRAMDGGRRMGRRASSRPAAWASGTAARGPCASAR